MFKRFYFTLIKLLFLLLCLFFLSSLFFNKNFFFIKNFTFLVFFLYLFLNIFFYFSVQYQFSKYTSFIKFFWQRIFILFWLLEFYLFFLFLYLYFFCPEETRYFLDYIKQTEFNYSNNVDFYIVSASILILVFSTNKVIFYFKKTNQSTLYLSNVLCVLVASFLFFKECTVFKDVINQINSVFFKNNVFIKNSFIGAQQSFFLQSSGSLLIEKSVGSMFLLISVIKFFHVFLIFLFLILTISKFFNKNSSKEVLSVNLLNVCYLYLFYILNFFIFLKQPIQFFLTKKYIFIFQESLHSTVVVFVNEIFSNFF